jgi:HSP20 family protein
MRQEDVQVSFSRGCLRIRGEKRRMPGGPQNRIYHIKERVFGRFERRIALPQQLETARAEISCRHGVVTVIVPKITPLPPAPPIP